MSLPSWLAALLGIAPIVVATEVPNGAKLAPFVAAGIHAAEQIPGADGPAKLTAATQIAQAGIAAATSLGAPIDADATDVALGAVITAVVDAVNKVHGKN